MKQRVLACQTVITTVPRFDGRASFTTGVNSSSAIKDAFVDRLLTAVSALSFACMLNACIAQTSVVEIVTDPTGPLITTKSGGSATFNMYLSGIALGSAIIELTSGNPALGQPVPSQLTYAQQDWRIPQEVKVVGLDDGIPGNEDYALNFDLHGTSFLVAYTQTAQVPLQIISVDDVAAILTEVDAQVGAATVNVMLRTTPQTSVTLSLYSAASTSLDPNQLVFTPEDASVAQTVSVTLPSNVRGMMTLSASSDDPHYNGMTSQISLVPRG
jgi:hypothetical protein